MTSNSFKLELRRALVEERQKLKGATGTMDDSAAVKPQACQQTD